MTKKKYFVPGSISVSPPIMFKFTSSTITTLFSKELPFRGTDFQVSASLNTLLLTSSIQGSFVIFLPYPHEPHFLSPRLLFISHILFIITISTIKLYPRGTWYKYWNLVKKKRKERCSAYFSSVVFSFALKYAAKTWPLIISPQLLIK